MKVEYINPFITATQTIFKTVCNEELSLGKIFLKTSPFMGENVSIILGITGDVKGQVIFSLPMKSALNIASKMMMGMEVTEMNEIAASAISELTNMILGNTATLFYNNGVSIDITPPSLLIGENIQITSAKSQTVCIPLKLSNGSELNIDVSLQEK